ncbi:MAG TPA: FCD domain-containing protein [Actinomycetota bacterium]|jgi:DNA-binding FadR family transcriptional regulator|nr:FCD domain-containing protein [Actinomycetota bacterium]
MAATELDDSRVSRAESMARRLEAEILGATVRPGDRLGTKDELRERFGVAVATVNEAIRLLQAGGLVDVRPGPRGGVFARQPSPLVRLGHQVLALKHEAVRAADCLQVRDALDPLVVADAARHCSAADAEQLWERLRRMRAARDDPTAFQRANWDLHRRIADISPNSILRSLYASLLDVVSSELATVIPDADFAVGVDELLRLHHELVAAITAGDGEQAGRAAGRHGTLTAGRAPPAAP